MSVASWTLLGFTLLAVGEVARESHERNNLYRFLPFLGATIALAYAWFRNMGWL